VRTLHSMAMDNAAGRCVDLHWHLTPTSLAMDATGDFWAASLPERIGGVEVRRLDPAHELFHALEHGLRNNLVPPLRWVADATTILRQVPDIDWTRLAAAAVQHRLLLPVREGLRYLVELLDAPVPPEVLAHLDRMPVSRRDRVEHWVRVSAHPTAAWATMARYWFAWLRHAPADAGVLGKVAGFPGYLAQRFDAENRRDLARVTAAKGRRRLRIWLASRRSALSR